MVVSLLAEIYCKKKKEKIHCALLFLCVVISGTANNAVLIVHCSLTMPLVTEFYC